MTNLVTAAEAELAKVATATQHAAAWVLGMAAQAETDVQTLSASSPIIAQGITLAKAWVAANPIGAAVEATAEAVLALVQKVDATSPPTTAPVAGSPADPAVIAQQPSVIASPA
jgi:hypothetical protein